MLNFIPLATLGTIKLSNNNLSIIKEISSFENNFFKLKVLAIKM
jgi:hypothetical protein